MEFPLLTDKFWCCDAVFDPVARADDGRCSRDVMSFRVEVVVET